MGRIVIAAACLCFLAAAMSGKPNNSSDSHASNSGQKSAISIGSNDDNQAADHSREANNNPPKWYASLKRPEWWLVVAAFVTLFVIGWQAYETRRAVQTMQLGNRAVIDSQRARLQIEITSEDAPGGAGKRGLQFCVVAVNVGQTIAEVFEVYEKLDHRGRDLFQTFESNPVLAAPDKRDMREPKIVFAKKRARFQTLHDFEVVPDRLSGDLQSSRLHAIWYGWVDFKDFIGREHRHRFFYMYSYAAKKFLPVGPPRWNSEEY